MADDELNDPLTDDVDAEAGLTDPLTDPLDVDDLMGPDDLEDEVPDPAFEADENE